MWYSHLISHSFPVLVSHLLQVSFPASQPTESAARGEPYGEPAISPFCFPSQETRVQIPWGVLMWHRDSPVSVVSLYYLCIPSYITPLPQKNFLFFQTLIPHCCNIYCNSNVTLITLIWMGVFDIWNFDKLKLKMAWCNIICKKKFMYVFLTKNLRIVISQFYLNQQVRARTCSWWQFLESHYLESISTP